MRRRSACRRSRRLPYGCGPRRSTSSSGSSTCSGRPPRCGSGSSGTGFPSGASPRRLAIIEDRMTSAIFYGPPGSGKTTLARIVANATGAAFEELSAVSATVAQVREVLGRARERLGASGERTILFLDEIHRFNKAQQDALLPAVEEGLVTLIGATTENPYFEVNSALLSRAQVYELEPLSHDDLMTIVRRGADEIGAAVAPELLDLVAQRAGGDARSALNILELT